MKLLLEWKVTPDTIRIAAAAIDPKKSRRQRFKPEDYLVERSKVVDLSAEMRLALIVPAFALLTKRALGEGQYTDDHIAHATNAAAILLAVLDTHCQASTFQWTEA